VHTMLFRERNATALHSMFQRGGDTLQSAPDMGVWSSIESTSIGVRIVPQYIKREQHPTLPQNGNFGRLVHSCQRHVGIQITTMTSHENHPLALSERAIVRWRFTNCSFLQLDSPDSTTHRISEFPRRGYYQFLYASRLTFRRCDPFASTPRHI
jgi:hypothetical protein